MENMTEGKYYCGICGWVSIADFPHCHETTFTAVASVTQECQRMIDTGLTAWIENGVIFYY